MLRFIMGALLMVCCTINASYAVEVYQWKDAGGITHFTDNEMNVPEKYRQISKRKVKKLQASGGSTTDKFKAVGAKIWLVKCSACHTTDDSKGNKSGLGGLKVNQKTKLPITVKEMISQLRTATNGSLSKMAKVDVTDKELKQLATFILGEK